MMARPKKQAGENEMNNGDDTAAETVDAGVEETNSGNREAAIEAEGDRIEEIGETAELNIASLGHDITQAALDIYRNRRFRWDEMSQSEQRDIATHIDWAVKATLRRAVQLVASNGRDGILAKLEKFADKGGEITLSMKIAQADEATIVALHRASSKEVMIVAADAADYLKPRADQAVNDQLPFEAGSDEHPADDSDLAGETQPQGAAEIVRHGDVIEFAGDEGEARIDPDSGMITLECEGDEGEPDYTVDFRPATVDELAAENERIAALQEA